MLRASSLYANYGIRTVEQMRKRVPIRRTGASRPVRAGTTSLRSQEVLDTAFHQATKIVAKGKRPIDRARSLTLRKIARASSVLLRHLSRRRGQFRKLEEGKNLTVAGLSVAVLHTPGHTPDSVLYVFGGNVATGDTLFVGECGRTDLPGGSPESLYDSLFGKLLKLEDGLVVLPGHDYGKTPTSTLGYERLNNYVLQPRTKEEFVRFMRS